MAPLSTADSGPITAEKIAKAGVAGGLTGAIEISITYVRAGRLFRVAFLFPLKSLCGDV